ncbi:phosphonoacetate hydrolase [Stutzerimonas kirkiae]|uniref:Phosphonoacetate hydrolase n=1 Tax=Stutzerimonas kirkiae TaxID=2211392 RepID=A0A4Q9RFK1_9GAMM|nr:phosphonoacetate hydrolase [Stutzerimonas kirkiae]TBU99991.1 phosphonoacetate hydrolase [Stutzerimonas kirkiae]TBV05697.1 phosphonoacetate hydrolase [Stutzerimonas kirkiae]TBV10560.1 phosphonoacetate hydrolase [Stutzerimonas kirkiae]
MSHSVNINGNAYRWPERPVVVVCIDGGDPEYLRRFLADGVLPNIQRFIQEGYSTVATGSMPSFTCPNNMSIITGTPTARHGISGNFYLDTKTWEPVVMTGPELLRGETILAGFAKAGAKVVSITAKDKLRRQLGKGLDVSQGHVSFSSEYADRCTLEENGIENALEYVGMPKPDMYSMELSLFVLEAGIRLLQDKRPDLMYLSLTDFVQHKWAPEEAQARHFYQRLDDTFGRLVQEDIVLGLIADHGMSDKSNEAGEPNVIWLQDILDAEFGAGETTVICPITDAFVAHHGALGSFVRIWRKGNVSVQAIIDRVAAVEGVDLALGKAIACRMFDLPEDREADVVVISRKNVVIGSSARLHDLNGLKGHRLRTHGGITETKVPFILNRPLNAEYRKNVTYTDIKSYQIFEFAINGTL